MDGAPAGSGGLIVVAGEALIDLVPGEDGELRGHPGGGPFNTARTIARLGQRVAFLGRVSADRFGRELGRALADDGVELSALVGTAAPTTLAVADVDPTGTAAYRFYVQGTAAPGLTPQAALAALPAETAILHVGSLGLALEPIAVAIEELVGRLAGEALIAVDPNCRAGVATDERVYRRRLELVLGACDVAKVSDHDFGWLAPDATPIESARRLIAGEALVAGGVAGAGPAVVLLTRGAEGAIALTRGGEEIEVPAPVVDVADTIGAGDAFGGAFLAWWAAAGHGRSQLANADAVYDATRFACAVAAQTCERAGASPPLLSEVRMPAREAR